MASEVKASDNPAPAEPGRDFVRDIVQADLDAGRVKSVVTRFPPEPNGYLHIGHAKSICLNFGIAQEFGGRCHLRFDDTNPVKEEQEYIDAIERDVRWLGFDWGEHLYHASDYFERLYGWAEDLIRAGKAYVDDQSQDEIRHNRGTLTEPGKNSAVPRPQRRGEPRPVPPHARRRIPQRRARAAGQDRHGVAATSTCATRCSTAFSMRRTRAPAPRGKSIRATISPTASRTPSRASRTRSARSSSRTTGRCTTGSSPISTCRRGRISTNSRGSISLTPCCRSACSRCLVRDGHVSGWDDPRMPTIAGLRRRGVPPTAIRDFIKRIGVAKANSSGRRRHVRVLGARGAQQNRAAPHGRAQATQSDDRELSGRAGRGARRGQSSRRSGGGLAQDQIRPRVCSSSKTIFRRPRRRNSSACRRARKCACAMRISSPAAKW